MKSESLSPGNLLSAVANFLKKHWPWLLVLGSALFFRFYHLEGFLHFANDEARDALVIKEMIENDWWRLTGPPTTIGNFNLGPFFYYFLLPFYLVSNLNPVAGGWAVATLDLITISLLYFFTAKHFSRLAAVIASILYITSFWINLYERWGWNPNILPFFTILVLWLCSRILIGKRRDIGKYLFGLAVVVGLAMQAHAQGLWLLVLVGILFIVNRRKTILQKLHWRRNLKFSLAFFVPLVLVDLPFLIFEFKTGGQNSRAIIDWVLTVRQPEPLLAKIVQGINDFIALVGQSVLTEEAALPITLLFVLPSIYFAIRYRERLKRFFVISQRPSIFALQTIFLLAGLLLFSFFLTSEQKYFHFLLVLAPALFIYLGYLLARMYRWRNWWSRTAVLAVLLFLVVTNISNTAVYWCKLDNGTKIGEFDLPLQDMRAAVDYIVANSCAEVKVRAEGITDEQLAFQYLFAQAGRGTIWSEGCANYEHVISRDITKEGKRFGRLTVLEGNAELR